MAEPSGRRLTLCPGCGRAYRPLARPKWRLLPTASEPLLAVCPDCRRRRAAAGLTFRPDQEQDAPGAKDENQDEHT